MRGAGLMAAAGSILAAASPQVSLRKIYGAENIKRHLQKRKAKHRNVNLGSIAAYSHDDTREIARRQRQAERDEANRKRRYMSTYGYSPGVSPGGVMLGISRRGRSVVV